MFTFFTLDVLLQLLQANMLEEPSTEQGGNQNHSTNSRALPSSVAGNTSGEVSYCCHSKIANLTLVAAFWSVIPCSEVHAQRRFSAPLFHNYSRHNICTNTLLSQLSVRTFSKDPAATDLRAVCLPC